MTVRNLTRDELPAPADVDEQVKQMLDDHGAKVDQFRDRGAEIKQTIMNTSHERATDIVRAATAYTYATYRTEQGQVDDMWTDEVEEITDIPGLEAVIRSTTHGGKHVKWFGQANESGGFERAAAAYQADDRQAAEDHLAAVAGSGGPKTPMVSLLLGFPGAFVMDLNVVTVMADFLKKTADLGHLPQCSACWNAANMTRGAAKEVDSTAGDFWSRRIWTKQPYFTNHHLSDHLDSRKERIAYRDACRRHCAKDLSETLSPRIWTQILFNVGQANNDNNSEGMRKTFFVHEPFYEVVMS